MIDPESERALKIMQFQREFAEAEQRHKAKMKLEQMEDAERISGHFAQRRKDRFLWFSIGVVVATIIWIMVKEFLDGR